MKKSIIFSAFFLIAVLASEFVSAQPSVKEERNLSGFTKVSFGVSGNLYISIGSDYKVTLEGDKDDLNDIITEVSADRLIIKTENWGFRMNDKVTVYVTMPEIVGLGVSGSGIAEIKDAVKTDNLGLSVSGSGKLYTSMINVSELKGTISGSGDIIMGNGGNASKAVLSISGSGNYSGESTKLASVEISISGSGNCLVNVAESLKASVSGSGNVTYMGTPKVDARVSGSGKIRSR